MSTPFATGCIPTPRHVLAAATPFRPRIRRATPATFLALPKTLSYWLNDVDGDCVTAEECFKLAAMLAYGYGTVELMVTDAEVKTWCKAHGVLNGADLSQVLGYMTTDGLVVNGVAYCDGPAVTVDYTDYSLLCAAIALGPVKLGVAAGQLQNVKGMGGANGWWATGFAKDNNEDHSTSLCGFGTAANLAAEFNRQQPGLNMAVPSGLDPTTPGVAFFTWCGVGFMDFLSLGHICGEAWLRQPNTVGLLPTPGPTPTPTPGPGPTPGPTPSPDFPMSGGYQAGVYWFDWTATLNDPPPPAAG